MRSLYFALPLLFLAGVVNAQSKADQLYEAAKRDTENGDATKAIKGFLSARTEYLKEANFHRVLTCTQNVAMYYQDTGDGKAAEKLILETIAVVPQKTDDQISAHASLQDNLGYTYLNIFSEPEKALTCYNTSIQLYEKIGLANTARWAFEIVNRAITYRSLNKFQLAVEDMLAAIGVFEKDPETNPSDIANHYHTLGNYYLEMSLDTKAEAAFKKASSLIENQDDVKLQAILANDFGSLYISQHQIKLAMNYFEKALALNEKEFGQDASNYGAALINIANAKRISGDVEGALADYQKALAIYQKNPPEDLTNVIGAAIEIANITQSLGMEEQTDQLLAQAQMVAVSAFGTNSLEEADVYMAKAVVAFENGQFDQSLNYNFKALDIMKQHNYPENSYYAQIYNNVGQAYDELKDTELALQYKTRALELYTKLRGADHHSVATATGNIGLTYEVMDDFDKAIDYLKKSVAIRIKNQPSDEDTGRDYLNIGLMYLKKNEARTAVEFFEKALTLYSGRDKNVNKAMICNRLSIGYFMLNDMKRAMEFNQKSIIANTLNFSDSNFDAFPIGLTLLDYRETVVAFVTKADIYRRQGDLKSLTKGLNVLDAADKILKENVINLTNARDRLELASLSAQFTESGMLLADKLFQLTKNPSYLEKAFYFSERSKSNELFADIQLNRATAFSRIPKQLTTRKDELSKRLNTLGQQVADAYSNQNEELITKLKAKEFDLTKELESVQAEMEKASPNFKSALNQRSLPAWAEVTKSLDAKTALISYVFTDSAKYVFIGNHSGLILKPISLKTDIERLVRGFTLQIRAQGSALQTMAQQLTEILWSPVESALAELGPVEKIIIIPQGSLNFLPFEALGKDSYLIEKYTIYYQMSGALLASQPASQVRAKPSFVALAPVFEDKETNFVNKSCARFAKLSKKADNTSRAFNLNGDYITPLPETETEVNTINKLNVDKGIFSKIFTKEAASEELIKKGELANYDFVHLATHGFVNSQYPELSGLLLTQDKNSSEDGILYTGEILGLSLKAELVTLSACETALGKKIEGEGVRGLTTAFLFAGARSVISSLWKVADESTSLLMIEFYTQLLSGKDKASALRAAKLSLIKDSKFNHPYYWSPFIQTGSN